MPQFSAVKLAMIFLLKVLVFSLIYFGIFFVRPDAFVFSNSFNDQPLTSFIGTFYETEDPKALVSANEERVREQYFDAVANMQVTYAALTVAQSQYEELEKWQRGAIESLEFSRNDQIELYETERVDPLEQKVRDIDAEINALRFGSDRRVLLATEKLFLLEEISREREQIVRTYAEFGDEVIKQDIDRTRVKLDEALQALIQANADFRNARSDTSLRFSDLRAETLQVASFIDFVYFSACIATTTTFGDIVPNNSFVRLLVVLQLITGLVIVASFLSRITQRT